MPPTALIAGITGQDGAYLARHLLTAGYRVVGSSRDAQNCDTSRLQRLGIGDDVELISLAPNDFRSVLKALSSLQPTEIYNLAGQTSVGLSFEQPVECMESIAGGTLNFLEVLRYLRIPSRLFSAGSSESFGDTQLEPANESTAFHPRSPYAVAKSTAFWQVANYREAYGIFCCTGILANHESPLRPQRFVTQKIVEGVRRIKRGESKELRLGNLDIWRDWGWAPEYVVAMHQMLQAPTAKDYLIASGHTTSLREFVRLAFAAAGLEAEPYLISDATFLRPSDLKYSAMDPRLIEADLGWKARVTPAEIVQRMFEEQLF
ncbi:MAG: GDP-mannose 4,6-dehydratase [Cyanobacteriota bacterium]|jgi:GDPmannose 4,6-dehydratase